MEKFNKLETTDSVENKKDIFKTEPINREDYQKKLIKIKEQEQIEDPDKNTADADLRTALEWAEMNNTKKLGDNLDNSMVMNNIWWNINIISPAQRITHQSENMKIPQ